MNKKQEIFLKFNKVVTKNQACLEIYCTTKKLFTCLEKS